MSSEKPLPLVSVVIPAFNAREFLSECIASVKLQTYPNVEIIIVDDGSSDGTSDWLAEHHPEIKRLRQDSSGAGAAPRNRGANIASGQVISFLDADDVYRQNHISNAISFLDAHPSATACFSNYQNFSHDSGEMIGPPHFDTCTLLMNEGGLRGHRFKWIDGLVARRILALENFTITSGMTIRRKAFEAVGGFDENLRGSEDFHLAFRVARNGSIGVLADIGFHRRLHKSNLSFQSRRITEQMLNSRTSLLESEHDSLTSDRLRKMLYELQAGIAMDATTYSRIERINALRCAHRIDGYRDRRLLKAIIKLVV